MNFKFLNSLFAFFGYSVDPRTSFSVGVSVFCSHWTEFWFERHSRFGIGILALGPVLATVTWPLQSWPPTHVDNVIELFIGTELGDR
jgi:hypothetical protein